MTKKFDYLTKETAYPIIARYLKTGGLASAFYTKEGMSESQFYTWRKRYQKDHPPVLAAKAPSTKKSGTSFHPIHVSSTPRQSPESKDYRIELEYPNGVLLRLDGALNDAWIASLIKLY